MQSVSKSTSLYNTQYPSPGGGKRTCPCGQGWGSSHEKSCTGQVIIRADFSAALSDEERAHSHDEGKQCQRPSRDADDHGDVLLVPHRPATHGHRSVLCLEGFVLGADIEHARLCVLFEILVLAETVRVVTRAC